MSDFKCSQNVWKNLCMLFHFVCRRETSCHVFCDEVKHRLKACEGNFTLQIPTPLAAT